jgi:hypothetical protein
MIITLPVASGFYHPHRMGACLVGAVWIEVFSFGKAIHAYEKPDGRLCWELVKPAFKRVPSIGTWSAEFLKEFDPRGSLNHQEEDHHFLLQHFKIPSENECSFLRLMQVNHG